MTDDSIIKTLSQSLFYTLHCFDVDVDESVTSILPIHFAVVPIPTSILFL